MRKEDLQNGMIVELRDGREYIVQNEKLIHKYSYCELDGYDGNLTSKCSDQFDIVKIYKTVDLKSPEYFFNDDYLELVWKRPEKKNFSKIELNVLKSIHPKWKWLVRDDDGDMILYKNEPIYNHGWHSSNSDLYDYDDECFGGFDHLFECISRDDKEPLYIDDYVKREEID